MARTLTLLLCVLAGLIAAPRFAGGREAVSPAGRATPAQVTAKQNAATTSGNLRGFSEQRARSSHHWGSVLTDIARHLPAHGKYQDAFLRYTRAGDLVTAGHEWTHFVNEYLSLQAGGGVSAYYILDGRYMLLSDPAGLRGTVPYVPASLRGELYQLYLVDNSGNAHVDPLYLLDEWTAYINDVAVAVDQLQAGKPLNSNRPDAIQTQTAGNVVEFMFYGFAVGMAVKKHDPVYYASAEGARLREFIALSARRSMEVHQKAARRSELSRGDARNSALIRSFRSAADTAAMRAWVKTDLGTEFAAVLGSPVALLPSSPDARGGI